MGGFRVVSFETKSWLVKQVVNDISDRKVASIFSVGN